MTASHAALRAAAPALHLPARPARPPRPSVPWLASAVPVVGALGFWALTGSVFALWFAVLGPLIAVAGFADGVRTARRQRRSAEGEASAAVERLRDDVAQHHARERAVLRARHPDVAGYLARRDHIWRAVPEREAVVVLGGGAVASDLRIAGGDGHPEDAALLAESRLLDDAPVLAPLGGGVAVVGPEPITRTVVRGIVLQLALTHPPGRLQIGGDSAGEDWIGELPHARVHGATRVGVGSAARPPTDADVVILWAAPGDPLPPACGVVLTLDALAHARAEVGAGIHDVSVESIGLPQARLIAGELALRSAAALGSAERDGLPLALAAVRASERRRSRTELPIVLGRGSGADVVVDLVRDGPHAVVTGMTGAGKSELLVSWVLALCAAYDTADVAFLLADFKGGTAFDPLARLPHVTGVITDLDEGTARRAMESLRAEMRHREGALAQAGVRDIAEVALPRLVIVVDEFAVLRETQPELEGLFADIAARGRALGMHLVLGSQRSAGVMRDALLANCALRISLRVADRLDSRALLGSDDAAELPGGEAGRGIALVKRSADTRAVRLRVAKSGEADLVAAEIGAGPRPRAPWLPALPVHVALDDIRGDGPGLALGILDDPAHQRQEIVQISADSRGLLIVGGPGSGRSTALRTLADQLAPSSRLWIGPDPEQAWDAVFGAATRLARGAAVFVDDLDIVLNAFPDEYAREAAEALELLVREAGAAGVPVFAATQRLTGVAARVADLLPRRLLLPMASRGDHVAAGGSSAGHALASAPGRGTLDDLAVQVAVSGVPAARATADAPVWEPPSGVSGYVTRSRTACERWERAGVRLRAPDATVDADSPEPEGRVLLVGTAEQWLARPRLVERLRAEGRLVVDVGSERDLRIVTGERSSPPYAHRGRGRAWLCTADGTLRRVTVDPAAPGRDA